MGGGGDIQKKVSDNENNPQMQSLKIGEHVIVFWVETGDRQWYLGLVDHINEDGSISVNHLVSATRFSLKFLFKSRQLWV